MVRAVPLLGRWTRLGACSALAAFLVACSGEIFDHGDPLGSGSSTSGASNASFSDVGSGMSMSATSASGTSLGGGGQGNFPEPATTVCGDLPFGEPGIVALASAWAVIATPNAHDHRGEPINEGTVRLRLSAWGLSDCGENIDGGTLVGGGPGGGGSNASDPSSGGSGGGSSGGFAEIDWGFAVSFSEAEYKTGEQSLGAMADPRFEAMRDRVYSEPDPAGSIEIVVANEDCMVGILSNVTLDSGELIADGAFVAQTCRRQCIPGPGNGC